MSDLKITEFAGIVTNRGGAPMQAAGAIVAAQAVAIGGASAQSSALNASTTLVRVYAEAKCTFSYGANPTATATNHYPLAADQEAWFSPAPGDKIAVISRA